MPTPKIFCVCTGLGITNRGIESFFRESFDGLKQRIKPRLMLFKGAGATSEDEHVLSGISRNSWFARLLGATVRRNGYFVEQLSALPSLIRSIRVEKPDVVFYSDSNLGFRLFRWRNQIGVPFRLLFSNGGPCHPPFDRTDFVHQVVPEFFDEALAAGEPPKKHFLVPYGIKAVQPTLPDPSLKTELRLRLGIPPQQKMVLSVGWVAKPHKRMDYVIEELAKLPLPRPHLVMLGEMDSGSMAIIDLATRLLGSNRFTARTVPYAEVGSYYQAADVFVLASLREGFGRVFLEALTHGLPVIAHDEPTIKYVVGDTGVFGNMQCPGVLSELLGRELKQKQNTHAAEARRKSVSDRFDWSVLAPQYEAMFHAVTATPITW